MHEADLCRVSMIRIGYCGPHKKICAATFLSTWGRYFFILLAYRRATLRIRTCDLQCENIQVHIIGGFSLNKDRNLYSVSEDDINDAILQLHDWESRSCVGV